MTYPEISRPVGRPRGSWRTDGLAAALRRTAETGLAILVPAERGRTLAGGLATWLKGQGYKVHRRRQGEHFVAWCERISEGGV